MRTTAAPLARRPELPVRKIHSNVKQRQARHRPRRSPTRRLRAWRAFRHGTPAPSRGANAPEWSGSTALGKQGGRRECRVLDRTRSLVCEKQKHTSVVTTGRPNIPAFPARWFYGFLRALPGDRAFLPPSSARCEASSPTWHQRRGARTTRLRRPRHAHSSVARDASIASRAQRFVTTAKRPSFRVQDAPRKPLIWERRKAQNFLIEDWTGQISLKGLGKKDFSRNAPPDRCPPRCDSAVNFSCHCGRVPQRNHRADYPHELVSEDLILRMNGVTVVEGAAARESNRREVAPVPRRERR
jgi:hypothetical protein